MADLRPDRNEAESSGLRLAGPLVPRRHARAWLVCEFSALYVLVPLALWFDGENFGRRIIPTLVGLATVFTVVLLRDPYFDRRRLWNVRGIGVGSLRMLRTLLPATFVLAVLTWWLRPELFLRLPTENPRLWLLVMVGYPLFSVYPQEIIFRTFLCHRYRGLFTTPGAMVTASAVAFGLAHLFFGNWLAPLLSTAGGWLFARTYLRSASTAQASLEHALWGDVIFTVGLGWYFYGGSIGAG